MEKNFLTAWRNYVAGSLHEGDSGGLAQPLSGPNFRLTLADLKKPEWNVITDTGMRPTAYTGGRWSLDDAGVIYLNFKVPYMNIAKVAPQMTESIKKERNGQVPSKDEYISINYYIIG